MAAMSGQCEDFASGFASNARNKHLHRQRWMCMQLLIRQRLSLRNMWLQSRIKT
jgi:hypothetical protein